MPSGKLQTTKESFPRKIQKLMAMCHAEKHFIFLDDANSNSQWFRRLLGNKTHEFFLTASVCKFVNGPKLNFGGASMVRSLFIKYGFLE